MRVGPSRLTSTAVSSGESNDTAAAAWITTSHDANTARSSVDRPRPSVPTSPEIVVIRRSVSASNDSAAPSARHSARRRSKASLRSSSRSTRRAAGERFPERTTSTSSQPGTHRSNRSTRAVPTKPVAPVMAMRLPASDSAITPAISSTSLYQMVDRVLVATVAPTTRDRILAAALDLFGTRGVDAVSLDDIAAVVGVRKQTVLYWFASKEELVDAVLEAAAAELAVVVDAAVRAAPDDPLARVDAVVRAVFRPAVRRPALLGLVRELSRLPGEQAERLRAHVDPLIARRPVGSVGDEFVPLRRAGAITVETSGAAVRMASTSAARSAETTSIAARPVATMVPRSRAGSNGFTGAGTAPIRKAPRNTS